MSIASKTLLPDPETDAGSDLAWKVLTWVDAVGYRPGSRALALGPNGGRWVGPLTQRGFTVRVEEDAGALRMADGSVDLAVAVDVLEHVEWDRWVLQQVHRVLATGGRLMLAVPNRLGLASPLIGGLTRRVWRSEEPAPSARRRYRLAALLNTLDALGYGVEQWSAESFGWLAPLARFGPGALASVAPVYLLQCERRPSLFGEDARRPYPDPEAHRQRFEERRRRLVDERERWRERHPEFALSSAGALEPGRYRGQRVLVLAPHPDDEIIGCGGTLVRLVAEKAQVTVLHATDGAETASLANEPAAVRTSIRLEEARSVAELLGFATLVCWREAEARFRERDDLVARLATVVAEIRPTLLFTPFFLDGHRDHRVLARLLARALLARPDAAPDARILSYEVWSPIPANAYCDVTDVVALQERALFRYATAMKVEDYVHFCQDRGYYNACTLAGHRGFVEAFLDLPAPVYARLATGMDEELAPATSGTSTR